MTRPSACWRLRELGLRCTSADGHAAHGASWRDTVPGEARALAVADRLLSALPGECRPLDTPATAGRSFRGWRRRAPCVTRARARTRCTFSDPTCASRAMLLSRRPLRRSPGRRRSPARPPPGAAACRGPRRRACARAARGPRCRTRLAAASPAALPGAACM